MGNIIKYVVSMTLLVPLLAAAAPTEDGYDLWLRYRLLDRSAQARLAPRATSIVASAPASATTGAAVAELQRGLKGMLGKAVPVTTRLTDGALVLAKPDAIPQIDLASLGEEGYLLRATRLQGRAVTLIAANSGKGLLYGAFAWLRAAQTGAALARLDQRSVPGLQLRVLNHWDNLDRSVERGYAGESIWNWWKLPEVRDQRYTDYARANASLGINGTVLNNVNASAEMLTAPFIAKAAALADTLRPYGIKVYLSVRFSTPLELKETASADPRRADVAAWWQNKASEIYRAIPDFGGFLVKANSEGQPGPQDYHRSHADGANMLAKALAPYHGVVMWRAFVYAEDKPTDRARQAFDQFKPLDGQFDANVIVQVKNGAIDFQPREPFHPLFGAMPNTPLMLEFQITKEYLGFATHLAYLGSLYEETLQSDTGGASVAQVLRGMAGVANIGSDRNWSGSHFDQANWYAYGRLAWDPHAGASTIAREWIAQTFTTDPAAIDAIAAIMLMSREAVVNYMTPLGLHHVMGTGHHHGPAPWVADLKRPEWNPVYYHQADQHGIGFNRTASGSNAIGQYAPALARRYANPRTTPEQFLLWFHHLPWDTRMASGRSLWAELIWRYDAGVAGVDTMLARWMDLRHAIDPRRHAEVAVLLRKQREEAIWWRDASIAYFQSVSGLALPAGARPPAHSLDYYKAQRFPFAPGHGG